MCLSFGYLHWTHVITPCHPHGSKPFSDCRLFLASTFFKMSYIRLSLLGVCLSSNGASLEAQWWRIRLWFGRPLGIQEMQIWSRGLEDPLEKEMATHSSILTWEIPCTEEAGGLQSMGSQELDTTEWLNHPPATYPPVSYSKHILPLTLLDFLTLIQVLYFMDAHFTPPPFSFPK